MKLKTLVAKCKRDGVFRLYNSMNDDGRVVEQWLGGSGGAFLLHGLPILTEDNLAKLFELTEKIAVFEQELPEEMNFADTDHTERILDRAEMTLSYGKYIVCPLVTSKGLELIDYEHLAVLADVGGNLELYERRTNSGQIYIAAKIGLMLIGVIMPLRLEEAFVDAVEALAENARAAKNNKTVEAREAERTDRYGQRPLFEGGETE